MLAALPPIAGSTPITTPMNDVHSSRNGRDRISHSHLARARRRALTRALDRVADARGAAHLLDVGHDLREGEHADQHRQERDAALEKSNAEREPRRAHHRVVAEHGDDEPEHAGEEALCSSDASTSPATIDSASTNSEKYSHGPNCSANAASGPVAAIEQDPRRAVRRERRPDAEPERAPGLALAAPSGNRRTSSPATTACRECRAGTR